MAPSEAELDAGIVFGVGALNYDEVRPRLDIDVMIAKQPDVFNLLLLALMDLKADSSKLGYYQLAGESARLWRIIAYANCLIRLEFMGSLLVFGMALAKTSLMTSVDIVPTAGSSFQHGTGRIWLCLRSDALDLLKCES
jgi:hypothetical protein